MKRISRLIASVMILCVMFIILATSVFAAGTTVTEYAYTQWRGNGSSSGRGIDSVTVPIGKNETVVFRTDLDITIDPNTPSTNVTASAALRQWKWYGYSTLINQTLYNSESLSNSGSTAKTVSRYYQTTDSTNETGDYYMVANTSGSSSAFYYHYLFTISYTVAS